MDVQQRSYLPHLSEECLLLAQDWTEHEKEIEIKHLLLVASEQASVGAAGESLKGEEKSTTYLNRLWKQFHLSPLAHYHSPDGALIIKNANCKNAANWLVQAFQYFSCDCTT